MEAFHIDNMTGQNNSGASPNDPLTHLAVSSLIGDNIFNPAGETLGKIKDIMIDIIEAKIAYVVIEFGGFLGMNQKYFAVPMQALTIAKEHKNAFILNETKESLKRYPGFDKDHWPNTNAHTDNPTRSNESGLYMNDIKNPEELWTVQKAKLKVLFTNLHDEDFHYDYGKKDVMLELLQKKLGKSREELNLLLLGL